MNNNNELFEFGFKLDDFQQEALNEINQNNSVIVCAPTGAGKTLIAEFAIRKALKENKRLFYTTPLKALSNQKFNDFSKAYGEDKAGLLTGDISINRNAQIVVMTTEVFRNMLYGTNLGKVEENLKNVGYVVLDEVHYMNDEQRGTVWEESIIYSPNDIQIIALSATVANAQDLTDWINTVHGKTVLIDSDFRPVPLRHFYYSGQSNKIYPLFTPEGKMNSKIKPEKRTLKGRKNFKDAPVGELIKQLHMQNMLPAIHFTFSRRKCDKQLEECSDLKLLSNFEKKRLSELIDEHIKENPYLKNNKQLKYLYCGVASHHAGLLPGWKSLVEKLFQQGLIKVVFATETLAAGINMPARTTIISSITKRTDDGHRVLTGSEFLQMSGRAGRRGMDEVGFVITVASPYRQPEEVAELASAQAEPLASKFTPSYSMVLNLLQRFNIDESRDLILKSFGYYSSTERLKPLLNEQNRLKDTLSDIRNFACPFKLTNEDLIEYNKIKNIYIQTRKLRNTLRSQARQANRQDAPEVLEYEEKTRKFRVLMENTKCNICRKYKHHIKSLDIEERFAKRYEKINKTIEYEKDIYWRQFLNLREVLSKKEYILDDYPTEKGLTTAALRTENELFFSEIIFADVLEGLSPSELAGILCAITTEEPRKEFYSKYYPSGKVKEAVSRARDISRHIIKLQKEYGIETPVLVNPHFSGIVEKWANGEEWETIVKNTSAEEGDIVRTCKRTIDLLRQLTIVANVSPTVAENASLAMDALNRDPIAEMF